MNLWRKILHLDRRWIFLTVAVVVALPIVFPLGLPVFVTPEVRGVFEEIDKLSEGSAVLVGFDYEPASAPECDPMADALLQHCFRRNLRVVGVTILPVGVGTGENALARNSQKMGRKRGRHYTYLGFKAEKFASIIGMGLSLQNTFQTDRYGNRTSELEVMQGLRKLSDFDYMVDIHDDNTLEDWVLYAHQPHGLRIGSMCTAVMAPGYYPYLNAGQITGIVGGLKGASEYEKLLGVRAAASEGMDSQAIIHILVIAMMILGNIAYLKAGRA